MLIANRLRRVHPAGEDGQALVLVVFLIFVLGLLSPLLMDTISATSKESNDSLVQAKAHAAAEAGINEYVAKLLNDTQYYAQYVAPGEATRQSGVNTVASVLPPAAPATVDLRHDLDVPEREGRLGRSRQRLLLRPGDHAAADGHEHDQLPADHLDREVEPRPPTSPRTARSSRC